jgi:hypothetical protein
MIHSNFTQPIQKIQDKLYQVSAEWPIERINNVTPIKEILECDSVFKTRNGTYIFCKLIEDIEFEPIS